MSEIIMQQPGNLYAAFIGYIDRCQKTAQTYTTNLRQFAAWTRYTGIDRPTRPDIIQYRDWLAVEHDAIIFAPETAAGWTYRYDRRGNPMRIVCKPSTVRQYLQSVKQFFSWTAAEGKYPNVAANIHTPKITEAHRKDSLSAADVVTIENSITATAEAREAAAADCVKDTAGRVQRSGEQGKRLYAMYVLAVNAGLRTIEISRANVRDVEVKNGQAYLMVWGKGHAEADQRKALAPEVYAAVREYLAARSDKPTAGSPLFVATGNRSGGKRMDPGTISKQIKQAMKTAGYDSDRLTAHSLRHTAGQNVMAITGDNLYQTQMYMRHSNPQTTEIYLDNDTAAQGADIAIRLYDHYHGRTDTGNNGTDSLTAAARNLTPEQIEQLTMLAEAMAARKQSAPGT